MKGDISVLMKQCLLSKAVPTDISLFFSHIEQRYLGTAREEETLNILLEFVPGGSISSLLGKFGSFPEAVGKPSFFFFSSLICSFQLCKMLRKELLILFW